MQTLVIRLLVFLALAGSANAGQTTYYFNFSAGGTGSFVYDDVAMTATAITFDFGALGSIAPYGFDIPLTAAVFGTPPTAAVRQDGTFFGVTRVAGTPKATVRLYTNGTYCLRPSPEPWPDYCLVSGTYRIATSREVPAQAVWSATGSMSSHRYHHSATQLGDGRVLVSGGRNDTNLGSVLGGAEIYNPGLRTWSSTGPMSSARQNHTATLLLDGRVLVSGGSSAAGMLATAEIYNPALGTWSVTGSMTTSRHFARAALLPDGRVLVTGGISPAGMLATAEIYNPALGTWSVTGSMNTARYAPTATVLSDGRVLVSGGANSSTTVSNSAEIYDPALGTWALTGSLTGGRYLHTDTRLSDGRVLVTGGWNGISALASAEIYDPALGTWAPAGSLSTPRYFHTAALLPNGKALVNGGDTNSGAVADAEIYDPALGTWSPTSSMTTARSLHTATLLAGGEVLVSGGFSAGNHLASAEIYGDPPPNRAPVANADSATTPEDVAVEIDVLANDTDADGDELFLHALGQPAHGTTSVTADGRIRYTPAAGYSGPDSFHYAIRDSAGVTTPQATVTVTVIAPNDAPVAMPDSANTNEDTAVIIRVKDNDYDADGDAISVVSVSQPVHGTVLITGTATVQYTPAANFNGPDAFTYVVTDGSGASGSATVSVTVLPLNDVPAAHSQNVLVLRGRPQPIRIGASDVEDDPLTFSVVGGPSHGSVEGTAPNLIYRPAAGYTGADSFAFTASDGSATSNTATVTIDVDTTVWDVNGPDGGTVLSMAVAPASASIVYARTVRSLWKSMDGGSTWSLVLQLPQGGQGVALDRASSLVVYAGVGNGIRKTTDGGATWQTYGVGTASNFVWAFAVDPFNAGVLFAASSQGVFKSLDAGATWAKVGTLTQVTNLWMDPLTVGTLYVRTSAGLLKSTDGAANWASIQAGLGDSVASLDFHPHVPGSLYALTSGAGVFKTTDGGATWTARNAGLSTGNPMQVIAVDPSAPDTVYVSFYYGLYRSTNGGGNWTTVSPQFNTFGIRPFALHPDAPGRVLVGSEAGVLRSTNSGVVWSRSTTGLRGGRTSVVAVDPSSPGTAFAGLYETGPFKTIDAGAGWSEPSLPNPGGLRAMVVSPHAPSRIFIGMTCGGLARSSDGGLTWTYGASGVTGSFCVNALAADPLTPGAVLAGTSAGLIYRTTTNGDAWVNASGGLPGNRAINAIVFDPSSPGVAYAATAGGGAFKSTDGGASWMAVNSGLTALSVTALAVDAASGVVYAATENTFNSASVFKSTNAGGGWTPVGLSGATIGALVVDPASRYVYAGVTDGGSVGGGVYLSTNSGGSWSALTRKGLVTTDVRSLVLESGRLLAGAWDGSVGVLVRATTPVLTMPADMTVPATSASGAVVTYSVTAVDEGDPSPSVNCSPASGSTFPITTRTVTCTASNAWGGTATGTFTVTVTDSLPPSLSLPSPPNAEATSPAGAVVTYQVSAVDQVDPAPVVSCVPASGSTFPLGSTVVTCTATDADGNSSTGSFTISVVDTVRPVISNMPTDIVREATEPGGAVVTWSAPVGSDFIDGPLSVTCGPSSGTLFAIGSRVVECSAVDRSGNSALGTFNVTVRDTTSPVVVVSLSTDSVIVSSPASVSVFASDAVGVASARLNGVIATLVSGTPQSGLWNAAVSVTVPGAVLTFTATAFDAVGNAAPSHTVSLDNDGISSTIDRNRTTLAAEHSFFSSDFVNGPTSGKVLRRSGSGIFAAPSDAINVSLSGYFYVPGSVPDSAFVTDLCPGAYKEVGIEPGEAARVRCDGQTLYVTGLSGVVEGWKANGRTCDGWGCWTNWYHASVQPGWTYWFGSPITAAPENPGPLDVELVRVFDDGTETQIGSYDLAAGVVFGSFALDPGESVDVVLIPGTNGGDAQVQVSVLSGTVTTTISGRTQTIDSGEEVIVTADQTPPVIGSVSALFVDATSPSGATVSYALPTVSDNVDAVPLLTASPAPGSVFPLGETLVTLTAVDVAGNTSTRTFKVTVRDASMPIAASSQSPSSNAAGWNKGSVTVSWNWSDTGTGLDPAQCPATSTVSTEGTSVVTATCRDFAGNIGQASRTILIDSIAPTIEILSPTAETQVLNATVLASYSCSDQSGLSGVSSCNGTNANGAAISTAPLGAKVFTVNATDVAGNTATASVIYTVRYNFSGFFSPVDNLPIMNVTTAGSAIPVKFQLQGNQGMNVLAAGAPFVTVISCNNGEPRDDIEQTVAASSSGLTYDSASGTYSFVWKSVKAWAESCRQLNLRLADGTEHVAHFRFR